MPRARALALIASLFLLGSSIPASASTYPVSMKGGGSPNFFYFSHTKPIVVVGDTIRWVNASEAEHTVTAYKRPNGARPFDSSPSTPETGTCDQTALGGTNDCIQPGDDFEFTFNQPGTYEYYCKVHSATAAETVKPDPRMSAQAQPCQMCALVEVRVPTTRRQGSTGSTGGSTNGSVTPRKSERTTPRPSATPTADPIPTADGSNVAAPDGGGNDGGGKTALALLLIVALSGAGYAIWRRFLVVR